MSDYMESYSDEFSPRLNVPVVNQETTGSSDQITTSSTEKSTTSTDDDVDTGYTDQITVPGRIYFAEVVRIV